MFLHVTCACLASSLLFPQVFEVTFFSFTMLLHCFAEFVADTLDELIQPIFYFFGKNNDFEEYDGDKEAMFQQASVKND